ncbi:hypothetical protein BD414DRAFT_485677 [Trametes punicea]|nr:hypothetical protein BD414DRAFT_485677 [Trametes punicea]
MLPLARIVSFAFLALSFLTLAHASIAARRAATNAERLARGLPPARPRTLYNPSRTNVARSAPSGAPGSVQTGTLGFYSTDASGATTLVGYFGPVGMTTNPASAWTYHFTEPSSGSSLIELTGSNTQFRLCGVSTTALTTLGPGSPAYLKLGNSRSQTPPGSSTAVYKGDTYVSGYMQSDIFTLDSNGKLSVNWVNPDGSVEPQYLLLYGTTLYVTGDVGLLRQQFPAANPVDLIFNV